MTFQARSTRVRYDRHPILPCNVDNLDDILCRVRIYDDAVRTPYKKDARMSAN
jgi:hypothetical protein